MKAGGEVMSPERWERVQHVFIAAIACDPRELAALLDRECGEDVDLRREVESLVDADSHAGAIDRLSDQVAPTIAQARACVLGWEGRTVGQYGVLEALGSGAMGVVYKARDERLGRYVALKFLPPYLGARPEAKRRFLREARAAAALDHPCICTIHEIGETAEGQLFIAMPLYEGETLEARLQRGPLSLEDAVSIARHIAAGLEQAHAQGIVHRDVKPSNVMLLREGVVKVLDFGVAQMEDVTLTDAEAVLGTLAYMSPEQARGERVDQRADIWSVGVVLYEMLTGTRPFRGDSRHGLTDAILMRDPDPVTAWRADLPAAIDDLLREALAKSPDQRYGSMSAMAADLAALAAPIAPGRSSGRTVRSRTPRADEATTTAAGAERRWAALVVSVLCDYHTLVERLTERELDTLTAGIRAVAGEVARRHGGIVNQAIGDEIVSLFGVPAAHDDDDLRAVRAAMELRQRVREVGAPFEPLLGAPVCLQSGVHVGLIVAQRLSEGPRRYAISGAPVQIAVRLAACAERDGVLLSPEGQRLVAPFVEAEPAAMVTLHEAAGPVTPFRVLGESGLHTRLEAAERAGLTPYTGRDAELATLLVQLDAARGGEGRVTTVVGEAGAGKSRLLYELRERVSASETRVTLLQGRCRPPGTTPPYVPFVEVLHSALGIRAGTSHDVDDVAVRLGAIDAALEPFIPLYLHLLSMQSARHPLPRHLQGEHLRTALLEALTALVAVLARQAPTLLLLEDWQWVDDASRAALQRIVEIVGAHPLLIVVTSRPEPGALADCGEDATRLQLAPLGRAASAAIMRAVLRVDRVSDALAGRVHERTGGNPFFLEQVCHTLLEEEAVATQDGEAVATSGVEVLRLPETVQAVIRARLDRLDQHARDVLRVAAVIGREFGRGILGEALGKDVDPTHPLERLKASGLIQLTGLLPEPIYRFRHVLTQEVAYDSLLARQRRTLHEVVGRALERCHTEPGDDRAELLAHHFAQAAVWREAIHYGQRAAGRAAALSQFADALATLERVRGWIAHLTDDDARADALVDLLLQQERVSETLGLRGRQQQMIEELIAILAPRGPSARLVQSYLRQGDVATLLKRFSAAERALSTALRMSRALGEAALERNALRSIGLLRWHEGHHAQALHIAESALAIDRDSGDDLAVAGDLANIGIILKSMGEHARALVSLEEALAMPALAQEPAKLLYALHNLANVHRALGDLDRALECLQRANEIARANLVPIARSFHLTAIAHVYLQQGRVDLAIQTYREAIALSERARHADGLAQSQRALGEVLFALGKDTEALPCLREAARLFAQLEDREAEGEMSSRIAVILERASWLAEAAHHNTLGIREWQAGHFTAALQHYEAGLRLVRAQGHRAHEGLMLNSIGLTLHKLSRHDEARAVLDESIALNREIGEGLLEAHALAVLGDVWRACGRPDLAASCFEQSLALRVTLVDLDGERAMRQRLAETRAATGAARIYQFRQD